MSQNDALYKMLFDYIQQDTRDKNAIREELAEIKATGERTETQTIKTNGRVNELENQFVLIKDNDKKQVIVGLVNKRWLAGVVAVIGFIWSVVSVFIYTWIQKKFF